MNETTNDATLLKTLVCLERQQHEQIPDEYLPHKRKLSTRFGLVLIEDKIIVPKNLRTTIISLLHKGHPAINKMTAAARHFWWPKMTEAIQKYASHASPAKCPVRTLNLTYQIRKKLSSPVRQSKRRNPTGIHRTNHGRQPSISHFIVHGPVQQWPAASFCTSTDGETAIKFLEQYIQLNGVPKTIRTDKATAFTGRLFRNFCKEHYIKLIYGTPYIHTPTGLVERGSEH